jgi:hypothetical protein
MTPEWVAAVAGAVSAILVPGALWLAARQWREMAKQTERSVIAIKSSVYQSFASQLQEIALLFIERPELRKYFYDGSDAPRKEPQATQARALAAVFLDFMDTVAVQVVSIPEQDRDVWFAFFRDLLTTSPVIRQCWADTAEWYSLDLRRVLGTPGGPAAGTPPRRGSGS